MSVKSLEEKANNINIKDYYTEGFWYHNPVDYCTVYTCKLCGWKAKEFETFPQDLMVCRHNTGP